MTEHEKRPGNGIQPFPGITWPDGVLMHILSYLIRNLLKIEPFGVTRRAWGLNPLEDVLDVLFGADSMADIQKGSDNQPRHIVKEIICIESYLHLLCGAVYFNIIELSHSRLALLRGGEVLKIMGSHQKHGSLTHHLLVRNLKTVVGILPVEHAGDIVYGHAVHISLGNSVQL